AVGSVILMGVRRAAFSNEAGIGTAPMAHGAAKTQEPVREGLIAMLGPAIDTLVVCTFTALAIIVTGAWEGGSEEGIAITLSAFAHSMPEAGPLLLTTCVVVFSLTTLFSYFYYGTKCLNFLLGARHQHLYRYLYVLSILFGAVASLDAAVGLIDGMFALMAIPTTVPAILLAPKVRTATRAYFTRMADQR
ncbi:MAG: sodium/alanine symporter, partial [Bacteroidetes bacterium]